VLKGEGDPYDSDGAEQGEEEMGEGDPDSPKKQPEDVHENPKGIGGNFSRYHLFAEGDQTEIGQFETLHAERDPHHREA